MENATIATNKEITEALKAVLDLPENIISLKLEIRVDEVPKIYIESYPQIKDTKEIKCQ